MLRAAIPTASPMRGRSVAATSPRRRTPPASRPRAAGRPSGGPARRPAAGRPRARTPPRAGRRDLADWWPSHRGRLHAPARHSSASATSSANNAGWVYVVSWTVLSGAGDPESDGVTLLNISTRIGSGAAVAGPRAPVDRVAERRPGLVQLPSHPRILASLPENRNATFGGRPAPSLARERRSPSAAPASIAPPPSWAVEAPPRADARTGSGAALAKRTNLRGPSRAAPSAADRARKRPASFRRASWPTRAGRAPGGGPWRSGAGGRRGAHGGPSIST